jgi:hypothetical protein
LAKPKHLSTEEVKFVKVTTLGAVGLVIAAGVLVAAAVRPDLILPPGSKTINLDTQGNATIQQHGLPLNHPDPHTKVQVRVVGPAELKDDAIQLGCTDCTPTELASLNPRTLPTLTKVDRDGNYTGAGTYILSVHTYTVTIFMGGQPHDTGARITATQ